MFAFYKTLALLLAHLAFSTATSCLDCVNDNDIYCVENSQCYVAILGVSLQVLFCTTTVKDAINCPRSPANGYAYNDTFARIVALPYISAAYAADPTTCLQNQLPTSTLGLFVKVNCTFDQLAATCSAFTAYDSAQNVIVASFKGSEGTPQIHNQVLSFFQPQQPFFDKGYIYEYYNKSTQALMDGGIMMSLQGLMTAHPSATLWVFGHSLGAAEASVFASYLVKEGIFTPDRVRLLTFGQPRTGTVDFAQWHDDTFLYSYRVIHQNDIVPKIPPMTSGTNSLFHHRYEVWYDNDMTVGSTFALCTFGDGFYCSQRNAQPSWNDHNIYFNVNITAWAAQGCPNL